MIQLQLLSGTRAGERFETRQFPISVGRDSDCALSIPEAGVFSKHFEIRFSNDGFSLVPIGEASVALNGTRTNGELLRNGDTITAGYAKFQFWLGAMPQRGLKLREAFTWLLIAAMGVAQIYLLWRLLEITRS